MQSRSLLHDVYEIPAELPRLHSRTFSCSFSKTGHIFLSPLFPLSGQTANTVWSALSASRPVHPLGGADANGLPSGECVPKDVGSRFSRGPRTRCNRGRADWHAVLRSCGLASGDRLQTETFLKCRTTRCVVQAMQLPGMSVVLSKVPKETQYMEPQNRLVAFATRPWTSSTASS